MRREARTAAMLQCLPCRVSRISLNIASRCLWAGISGGETFHSALRVFNVKKRSWKGGIQVAVEVNQQQLDDISGIIDFRPWLAKKLCMMPHEDRPSMKSGLRKILSRLSVAVSWMWCCNPAISQTTNVSLSTQSPCRFGSHTAEDERHSLVHPCGT